MAYTLYNISESRTTSPRRRARRRGRGRGHITTTTTGTWWYEKKKEKTPSYARTGFEVTKLGKWPIATPMRRVIVACRKRQPLERRVIVVFRKRQPLEACDSGLPQKAVTLSR